MAPHKIDVSTICLSQTEIENESCINRKEEVKKATEETHHKAEEDDKHTGNKLQIVWLNVVIFVYLHLGCLYGMYLVLTKAKLITFIYTMLTIWAGGFGITAGAHRLWAHKAYKANFTLKVILATLQTLAFQNNIYEWVRDHRVHHKFTDTNADPHNAQRGFFFSHIGWLMVKKHKDVKVKGAAVDMSDLERDPVVMFQKKYFLWLMPLAFGIPALVPYLLWNEPFYVAFHVSTLMRYVTTLNATWLVNSAAHIWGNKPYDKNISPTDSVSVGIAALGEGWHNYHHVFPWDYKAGELGKYETNVTTALIDIFAKLGWAYDLKTVPTEMIKKRVQRTGDGSHPLSKLDETHDMIWGWNDKDMSQEDRDNAQVFHTYSKDE